MPSERIRAELAAGVEHFKPASVRALLAELDACRAAAESVPDAICTLLNYATAPEIQASLMADALGAKPLAAGGWVLRVKGRDVHFVQPSYMWMWDDAP